MTTAMDIIRQYGRVVAHDAKQGDYFDIEDDMGDLALLVQDHGNAPITNGEDETTRDNLGLCLAGRDHWWWNCDEYKCPGEVLPTNPTTL